MGWLIGWRTKREVIAHLNQDVGEKAKLIKSCVRGDVLWQVIETPKGRFIACNILGGSKSEGFGYKDLCETMGVHRYSCPLSYLELVPDPCSEFSTPWREEVRKYHTKQRKWRVIINGIDKVYKFTTRQSFESAKAYFDQHFTVEYTLEAA